MRGSVTKAMRTSMFESNFPVDAGSVDYLISWNAFERTVLGASALEKHALFAGTAADMCRLIL